jgi:hypothetical protein
MIQIWSLTNIIEHKRSFFFFFFFFFFFAILDSYFISKFISKIKIKKKYYDMIILKNKIVFTNLLF